MTTPMSTSTVPLLECLMKQSDQRICLVVLNRPVKQYSNLLAQIWSKAVFKVFADGATNRVFDELGKEKDNYIPDLICGDFDSARKDVLDYYKQKGVKIIETPDQDETDFTKSVRETLKILTMERNDVVYDVIVCLGGFGGRFDHQMANVNTLFTIAELQQKPCYHLSNTTLQCLLQPGYNELYVNTGLEDNWCSMVPIGKPAKSVTTSGLKWNLLQGDMAFGSLISTSNAFDGSGKVTVQASEPLLWTMGIITESMKDLLSAKN